MARMAAHAMELLINKLLRFSTVLQLRTHVITPRPLAANQASQDLLHLPKERVESQDLLHLPKVNQASQDQHHHLKVNQASLDLHHPPRVSLESQDLHHLHAVRVESQMVEVVSYLILLLVVGVCSTAYIQF